MKKAKPTFLFLFLLHAGVLLLGQDIKWNKILSLSTGPSLPLSSYAMNKMVTGAGFANPGGSLFSDFLLGHQWVGLSASLGYTNHTFAKKAYQAEYERILNNLGETTVSVGMYHSLIASGGFFLNLSPFDQTDIHLNMQVGYAYTFHPEIKVENSYWGSINNIEKDRDISPLSSLGIILLRKINNHCDLTLKCMALFTKPAFRDDNILPTVYYLPVRNLNISAGVNLNLVK